MAHSRRAAYSSPEVREQIRTFQTVTASDRDVPGHLWEGVKVYGSAGDADRLGAFSETAISSRRTGRLHCASLAFVFKSYPFLT